MYEILRYRTPEGKEAFTEWIDGLRDRKARVAVLARLGRAAEGNFGDHKSCGGGLWEMRIGVGAGYRVYYGLAGARLVLLLCGGDKKTQAKDINKAHIYWTGFKKEQRQ